MRLKIKRRNKIIATMLLLYWLMLFIATHIPVPKWTRQMGMSDKTMHFLAFFVLAVLLWLVLFFDEKVHWLRLKTWLTVVFITGYAVIDEYLQHMVGRNSDWKDVVADIAGILTALLIMSFLVGVNALILLANIAVFLPPYLANSGLIRDGSLIEAVLYFLGFAMLTASWIVYLRQTAFWKLDYWEWIFSAGCFSLFVMTGVKFFAYLTNKPFSNTAILASFVAILITSFVALWITPKISSAKAKRAYRK